jgi:predicted nucleic acid-binding protein
MAANALVDAGFLIALLNRRDTYHKWAVAAAGTHPPPWRTCEAALSEAFHLLGTRGARNLAELIRRNAVTSDFRFADDSQAVLRLLDKYSDVPMSLADACLVRMTETLNDPVLLTTDADFRTYRRHGRQAVPSILPR